VINYLDLFSGIGGFKAGLVRAGFEFGWTGHSEIDKYAQAVYEYHYPKSERLGNVTNIHESELPERIHLITFGFPCQDLSVAGQQAGLEGARSSLFFAAMRIIRDKTPDMFIFENVKGLLSSNNGKDFTRVLREIADIGLYDCEWQLVNTRWLLPQNRERIYFIGHLRGKSKPKVFPFRESDGVFKNQNKGESGQGQRVCSTIDSRYGSLRNAGETYIKSGAADSQGQRVYAADGIATTLNASDGGLGAATGLYEVRPVLTPDREEKRQNGRRFKEAGDPSFTLTGQDIHGVEISPCIRAEHHNTADVHVIPQGTGIRRLTPLECERLQGFTDNWTAQGIIDGKTVDISDTQRYKCLGNAVTVDIVEMIGRRLLSES
jgi:DNA (cytosine-5)-methyltransferase 1